MYGGATSQINVGCPLKMAQHHQRCRGPQPTSSKVPGGPTKTRLASSIERFNPHFIYDTALQLDTQTLEVVAEYRSYVRPLVNPVLSEFCTAPLIPSISPFQPHSLFIYYWVPGVVSVTSYVFHIHTVHL